MTPVSMLKSIGQAKPLNNEFKWKLDTPNDERCHHTPNQRLNHFTLDPFVGQIKPKEIFVGFDA